MAKVEQVQSDGVCRYVEYNPQFVTREQALVTLASLSPEAKFLSASRGAFWIERCTPAEQRYYVKQRRQGLIK